MRYADNLSGQTLHRQYEPPTVTQTSATEINIKIRDEAMIETPTTYTYILTQMKGVGDFSGNYPDFEYNQNTNPIYFTDIPENSLWLIKTRCSSALGTGNTVQTYFQLKGVQKEASKTSAVGGSSFLQLVGGKENDTKYNIAHRTFGAIQVPSSTTMSILPTFTPIAYTGGPYHYSFGTSFIFPPLDNQDPQEAGFGFFLSDDMTSGYYVLVSTTGTAAARGAQPVRIIKVTSKKIIVLKTSQVTPTTTLDSVYGGENHTIDIKVKVGGTNSSDTNRGTVEISAFVDGFKITAIDKNFGETGKATNEIIAVTQKVALVAASGTVSFDYAYGTAIDADTYDNQDIYNTYRGKYSNDYLITKYGDILYVGDNADDNTAEDENSYDEFGTTAREIVKAGGTFSNAPAFPNNWNLGYNQNVTILDQRYSNFSSEIFVLNNTSQPVILSDQETNLLELQGTTVGLAGEITYRSEPDSEFAVQEVVSFKSNWIQTENDAKQLANFIKSKVVNKSKIISMTVFGNPLISVGDIITVNYPYHQFDDTQKIIVTSVNHEYNNGLTTSIMGRTI